MLGFHLVSDVPVVVCFGCREPRTSSPPERSHFGTLGCTAGEPNGAHGERLIRTTCCLFHRSDGRPHLTCKHEISW